jgi:hypothetical protein
MKILLIVCSLFCLLHGTAQIGKVEKATEYELIGVNNKGQLKSVELEKKISDEIIEGGKSMHILSFINAEYQSIRDWRVVSFLANDEDLEGLYKILYDTFETKESVDFKLGSYDLSLSNSKGKTLIIFVRKEYETSSYFYLNKRQLERLFGKR